MRLLKRIDVLVLKAFIGPFLATFVLSMFLFLMQFLWKYIDDLVGKGIEFSILSKLILYSLADLVPMALPLTIMVAGLMTAGNLSESFELVAMKSNGISLRRILMPLFILMCFLAIVNFGFNNYIIPRANLEAKALLYDLRQKKLAFNIVEGAFYEEIDGLAMRVGKKDKTGDGVEDILVYEYKKDDSKRYNLIRAKKGIMKLSPDKSVLYFQLFDGVRYDEMTQSESYGKTMPFNTMRFEKQFLNVDLSSLDLKMTNRDNFKGDHRLMSIFGLKKEIDTAEVKNKKLEEDNRIFVGRYFHFPNLFNQYPNNSTTSKAAVPVETKNIDKQNILENFSQDKRKQIVASAIQNTRAAKATVDGLISNWKFNDEEVLLYRVERHKKYTLSIIIILLFLISAPLGAIIRKGGIGLPLVISVIMFVLFYALNLVGEKIGKDNIVPLWVGMWLSSLILLPIGVWISYKASKDSAALSLERYQKFLKKYVVEPVVNFIDNLEIIARVKAFFRLKKMKR